MNFLIVIFIIIIFLIICSKKNNIENFGSNDTVLGKNLSQGMCTISSDCYSKKCIGNYCRPNVTGLSYLTPESISVGENGTCVNSNDCLSGNCDLSIKNVGKATPGTILGPGQAFPSNCQTNLNSGSRCVGRCKGKPNGSSCTNNYECANSLCGSNNKCGIPDLTTSSSLGASKPCNLTSADNGKETVSFCENPNSSCSQEYINKNLQKSSTPQCRKKPGESCTNLNGSECAAAKGYSYNTLNDYPTPCSTYSPDVNISGTKCLINNPNTSTLVVCNKNSECPTNVCTPFYSSSNVQNSSGLCGSMLRPSRPCKSSSDCYDLGLNNCIGNRCQ
jgi:hypothetical protein